MELELERPAERERAEAEARAPLSTLSPDCTLPATSYHPSPSRAFIQGTSQSVAYSPLDPRSGLYDLYQTTKASLADSRLANSSMNYDVGPVASTSAAGGGGTAGKKRARASVSKGSGAPRVEEELIEGDDEENRRKRRLALSCSECQRRKIKCDRKQPCSACIRRKVTHNCNWDDDPDASGQFALNSDVRHIHRRLAHLESLFQAAHPDAILLYNDSNIGASSKLTGQTSVGPSPASENFNSPISPRRRSTTMNHDKTEDVETMHRTIEALSRKEQKIDEDETATRQSQSDTEDAAADLEDCAFGARVPVLRAVNAAAQANAKRPVQARVGLELTSALTSIVAEPLSYDQDGRPRSAVRLGLDLAVPTSELPNARREAMAQILAVLPGKDIAEFLITKYLEEMEWDFRVIDRVAFPVEHQRFVEMLAEGRDDQIDPLWIAVFCMVLALSLEGFWSRPGGKKDLSLFRGLTERELQDLPSVFHDAALRALQLGEWGGTPRIRTIQTIILFGQYIQLSSQSGQQGRFLGWAASGIRVAQRMGLHRLGSNPQTMPPDDPALPPGCNSLKRDLAVRLFNYLVLIDSFLSDSAVFRCYILHESQYNTCRPLNLNFRDLSRTEWRTIPAYPTTVYTDASFEIAQGELAAQVRRALDVLVLSGQPFSYTRVIEQDKLFRQVLEDVPDVLSERKPPVPVDSVRIRYQRALIHEDVYARLVRLHRPFLSRGYLNDHYRFSTDSCVAASTTIINSNYELLGITSSLWWMFTSSMRASIVLFMDIFHAIDADLPEDEIKEKRAVLIKASIIFGSQVHSPALQAVVEQGRRILSGLFAAEESRRTTSAAHTLAGTGNIGSAPAQETFAQVLKRVSTEIAIEERAMYASNQHQLPPSPFGPSPSSTTSVTSPSFGNTPQLSYATPSTTSFEYWASGAGNSASTPYPHLQPSSAATPNSSALLGYHHGVGAGGVTGPVGVQSGSAVNGQDFASFFETLASEDWNAGFNGSDGGQENGLLGQIAATW